MNRQQIQQAVNTDQIEHALVVGCGPPPPTLWRLYLITTDGRAELATEADGRAIEWASPHGPALLMHDMGYDRPCAYHR